MVTSTEPISVYRSSTPTQVKLGQKKVYLHFVSDTSEILKHPWLIHGPGRDPSVGPLPIVLQDENSVTTRRTPLFLHPFINDTLPISHHVRLLLPTLPESQSPYSGFPQTTPGLKGRGTSFSPPT